VTTGDQVQGKFDVLIVNDHAHMRALLRDLLRTAFPGLTVADTGSGQQALKLVQQTRPRLVLIGMGLPDTNAIVLTSRITVLAPGTRVIIISDYTGAYVERAHAAGALAFVAREKIVTDLPPLIAGVFGEAWPPGAG
jgi:DNA-binding NarL/FixJ family response regulator